MTKFQWRSRYCGYITRSTTSGNFIFFSLTIGLVYLLIRSSFVFLKNIPRSGLLDQRYRTICGVFAVSSLEVGIASYVLLLSAVEISAGQFFLRLDWLEFVRSRNWITGRGRAWCSVSARAAHSTIHDALIDQVGSCWWIDVCLICYIHRWRGDRSKRIKSTSGFPTNFGSVDWTFTDEPGLLFCSSIRSMHGITGRQNCQRSMPSHSELEVYLSCHNQLPIMKVFLLSL